MYNENNSSFKNRFINDTSLVSMINYKSVKFLTAGDIEEKAEAEIIKSNLDIKADIFKFSHHGGRESNTNIFIDKINPLYAYFPNNYTAGANEILWYGDRDGGKFSDLVDNLVSKTNVLSTLYNGNILYNISPNGIITTDITRNYNKLTIKYVDEYTKKEIFESKEYLFNDRSNFHFDKVNEYQGIDGYSFRELNTEIDCHGNSYTDNQSINIDDDTILYAIYEKNYEEILKDGWHIVESVNELGKLEWAYYKNNEEINRLSEMIYVHRGWGTASENSLESIKEAKNNGYYAYETDVRFTKDNIPVLSHDATINRIARNTDMSEISEKKYVKNMTLNELKEYDFVASRTGEVLEEYKGTKITTFEEALKYSKDNGLTIAIELKAGTSDQIALLVNLVKKYNMDNAVKWISSNTELLKYVNAIDDDEVMRVVVGDKTSDEVHQLSEELKTENNTVLYYDNSPSFVTSNMPENLNKYDNSKYVLATIPKATLLINNQNVQLLKNQSVDLEYSTIGDGNLHCVTSNLEHLKCDINQTTKKLTLIPLKVTVQPEIVTLYLGQGKNYSASEVIRIMVNIDFEEISKEDVPNLAYIIGNYMFTRDINPNYDGKLTTRRIMLAAKSIESNKEADMIIYYKKANGEWIDAITGKKLTISNTFKIKTKNLKNV